MVNISLETRYHILILREALRVLDYEFLGILGKTNYFDLVLVKN